MQIEKTKNMTVVNKLHLIADTLRNCTDLKQGTGRYYDEKTDSFCVMGALAFRAGLPKDEVDEYGGWSEALKLYGIGFKEKVSTKLILTKEEEMKMERQNHNMTIGSLWDLNDQGFSFNEIADVVDRTADNL